jgi:hypothetical protein
MFPAVKKEFGFTSGKAVRLIFTQIQEMPGTLCFSKELLLPTGLVPSGHRQQLSQMFVSGITSCICPYSNDHYFYFWHRFCSPSFWQQKGTLSIYLIL